VFAALLAIWRQLIEGRRYETREITVNFLYPVELGGCLLPLTWWVHLRNFSITVLKQTHLFMMSLSPHFGFISSLHGAWEANGCEQYWPTGEINKEDAKAGRQPFSLYKYTHASGSGGESRASKVVMESSNELKLKQIKQREW